MRKFMKFLVPALLLVAVIVSCTVMFASANEAKVIYISQNGTGNGSSPEQAMGPSAISGKVGSTTYDNASYATVMADVNARTSKTTVTDDVITKAHPLYKAIKELGAEGGKIVVVGELVLDAANVYEKGYEGKMSNPAAGPVVIEGYDANAKLVLDHSGNFNSTHVLFNGDTTIQNIAIENRYNSSVKITTNSRSTITHHFSFLAAGNNLTMGTGITTTSFDYASGAPVAGNEYPSIYATTIKAGAITGNPVITVKSGRWTDVSAGGHCIYSGQAAHNADLNGNVIVNVEGGTIDKLWGSGKTSYYIGGTGATNHMYWSTVRGNSTLNISGGTVNSVYGVTSAGITGTLTINTSEAATIGEIVYKNTENASATENNGANTKPGIASPTSAVVNCYVTDAANAPTVGEGFTAVNVKVEAFPAPTPTPTATPTPTPTPTPETPIIEGAIYISMTGTGNGSSPEQAMGPGLVTDTVTNGSTKTHTTFENAKYEDVISWLKENEGLGKMKFADNALTKAHPLYKALEQIGENGTGTIVVVGDLYINAADAFEKKYAGDFKLPATGAVTIAGGNIILDHSTWDSTSLWLGGDTTFTNTKFEFRYNSTITNPQYVPNFSFYANGNNITIEESVTVTSYDYKTGAAAAGNRYPNIFATTRNGADAELEADPVITVKAGNWNYIVGAGHSTSGTSTASLIGNSTIIFEGGTVQKINATGVSPLANRQFSYVEEGDVSIIVKGGTVGSITCITGAGYYASENNLIIDLQGGKVGEIVYKDTRNTSAEAPASITFTYANGTIELSKIASELYGEIDNVDGVLKENVLLNLDYELTQLAKDAIAAGKVKYVLTIGDRTIEENVTTAMVDNNTLTITAELFATEMTADVSVKLVVDGADKIPYTTTFKAYAEQVATDDTTFAGVVAAVLNYGEMSQVYVGALETPTTPQADRKEQLAPYANGATVEGQSAQYTYKYSTLVLANKVAIRHYFDVAEGADTSIFDGNNGNGYYVEEAEILPADYAQTKATIVGDLTVNCSVFNYAYAISQQDDSFANAKNVVYALYDYYTAANAIA